MPDHAKPWPIPVAAVFEIAQSEGLETVAYLCPAGVWTIGWGETDGVHPGDKCTKEQADQWLLEDLQDRTQQILKLCKVEPSPNELGALTSLAYNIGMGGLAKSTVLRQHNAGNKQAASRAFGLWNKAKDPGTGQLRELAGLTARRAREAALYLKPEPGQRTEAMPQAIEAESKPAAGPISAGAVVAGGAGAVEVLSKAGQDLGAVGPFLERGKALIVDTLGIPTDWLLPIVVIVVAVLIYRARRKQREGGWA